MKEKRIQEALLKFRNGSSCAQCILSTYLPLFKIPETIAHRMGAGLGSGVGRKQYICGALNAGAIVISALIGNEASEDIARKDMTSQRVRQFVDKFEEKFKSSQCLDIIGINTSTEEGKKKATEANVSREICDSCVETVCTMLETEFTHGR